MRRVTKRRHRHPPQNTSLPGILGIASTNMTIKVLSLATDLDSLTRPIDPPAMSSNSRAEVISLDNNDHASHPTMATSSPPDFAPFYATDASMSSIAIGGGLYYPAAAMAAESSVTDITTSTGGGIGELATVSYTTCLTCLTVVLASPLSAGSPASSISTESSQSSMTLSLSSISQTPTPAPTDSSEPAASTVANTTPSSSTSSTQSSTDSSSAHNSTFTGCTYNIDICLPDSPGKHVGPRFHFWGLTIGLPASIMFVLIVWFLLWKFGYCKPARRVGSPKSQPKWRRILGYGRSAPTNADAGSGIQQIAPPKECHDLGKPGPAFNFYGMEPKGIRLSASDVPMPNYKRMSNMSWHERPVNPFSSIASTTTENQITGSKIGIALTRYSTVESSLPLSNPISPMKEHKICDDYGTDLNPNHHRHSSTSISSDATARFDPQVTPLQTATIARRHSLTPRIINIVAASGSSDQVSGGETKHNNESPGCNDINRNSLRSRSMSPSRFLLGYASFTDEISDHRAEPRPHTQKTSQDSNSQSDSSASTKATVVDMTKYPIIPNRGRSVKRTAEAHISSPPTSYPNLGKTMADVKKTIREKGSAAFASTDDLRVRGRRSGTESSVTELPSSVTVTRGRGG